MVASGGIYQLGGYPHVVAGLAYAALQHVRHSQLAAYVLHLRRLALVGEGRRARDDKEVREPGESGNKVVGHAIAEIFLVAVATHVCEGQHHNRGLVGQWESGRPRRRNGCRWSGWSQGEVLHEHDGRGNYREPGYREDAAPHILSGGLRLRSARGRFGSPGLRQHPEYSHRFRDVLDRLLAEVLIAQRKLVPKVLADGARDADAARFREALEARGDVDAIAVDLLTVDHHVAEVHADPEFHPALGCQRRVLGLECGLNLDRALDGIHDAGKLREHAVARRIDEASVMLIDERID